MKPRSFHSRLVAVFVGELVNKACVSAAFIWLARTLDPAVYGEAEWALSLTMVFAMAADAGLSTWAAAGVAANPDAAPELVARVGWLRLALAVPAYLLLIVAAWWRGGSAGVALVIYGLVLFLAPLFLQYLFDGLQTRWGALGSAVRGATFLAAVVLLANAQSQPSTVATAEVLGASALALCNLIVFRCAFKLPLRILEGRHGIVSLLERSWRVGASDVTWGVHSYAGVIILGYVATPQETAWHSASLRLLLAIHTGVWLYLSTLLPNLSRLVRHDVHGWRRVVDRSLRLTGWVGCGIALVCTLEARTILTTVFGQPFAAATPDFRAMIRIVPIAWMSGHIRYSLIAAEHPQLEYRARLVGAATTIVLTVLLVPTYRSAGAGIALLGGTIANTIAAWTFARGVLPSFAYGRSVVASSATCLVCFSLGLIMIPLLGDVPATLVAGALLATAAVVVERDTVRELLRY